MVDLSKINLDENYLYISHLDEGLQFWKLPLTPTAISDNMQSTFSSQNALGRSAPVFTFSNAGPRTVQIALKLHRDMMDDVNTNWSNAALDAGEDYMDALIRALQAIALPKYNLSNKAIEPPLLALRLGTQVFVKGVLSGSIGLSYEAPIFADGKYAQVNLNLAISEVDPYDSVSVYKNGGFRGMMNTLWSGMSSSRIGSGVTSNNFSGGVGARSAYSAGSYNLSGNLNPASYLLQ